MEIKLEYLKYNDLAKYKGLLDDVLGASNSLKHYQAHYKENHPNIRVVVAKKEGEIVGTITFALIDTFTSPLDPKIEFSNFATSLTARGTDAATLLMNFVSDYAKEHGYKSVAVNCLANAERAHRFYEKIGFKKLDHIRFVMKVGD
jgi:GNAT superfamily N-acetyltransferase